MFSDLPKSGHKKVCSSDRDMCNLCTGSPLIYIVCKNCQCLVCVLLHDLYYLHFFLHQPFFFYFFFLFYFQKALDKAKEAGRKERALCRQREQASHQDQINLDLTYSVSTALCWILVKHLFLVQTSVWGLYHSIFLCSLSKGNVQVEIPALFFFIECQTQSSP